MDATSKRTYTAVGRDNGVIVDRCGHKHKSYEAAIDCGNKQWHTDTGDPLIKWHFGGVVNENDEPVGYLDYHEWNDEDRNNAAAGKPVRVVTYREANEMREDEDHEREEETLEHLVAEMDFATAKFMETLPKGKVK